MLLQQNVDLPKDGAFVAVLNVTCTDPPPELKRAAVRVGADGIYLEYAFADMSSMDIL